MNAPDLLATLTAHVATVPIGEDRPREGASVGTRAFPPLPLPLQPETARATPLRLHAAKAAPPKEDRGISKVEIRSVRPIPAPRDEKVSDVRRSAA